MDTRSRLACCGFVAAAALGACGRSDVDVSARDVARPEQVAPTTVHAAADPTMHREPDSGLPGSAVNLSGTGCLLGGAPMIDVHVRLYRVVEGGEQPFDQVSTFPIDASGDWTGVIVVAADAPAGNFIIEAACTADDQVLLPATAPFTILDSPGTTTSSVPSITADPGSIPETN